MKNILLIFALTAPVLFAQTNSATGESGDIPAAEVSTNGPLITAVDGYAARVDSSIITYGEVRESAAPVIQQLVQRYRGKELADRMQSAYIGARESLIEEALFKAETKTLGLSLPERIVDDEVNRLIRERFNNDRTLLTRALAARRMTFDEWKQQVRDQITVRVFYNQEVTRRATVSEEAIRADYEQNKEKYFIPFKVKYRFILINKGSTEEDLAVKRKQAEDTLKKLRDGASFEAVAKEVSAGDLAPSPWRELKDVREELRPALLKTSAGQISDLIETPEDFYIVRVEEWREEGYIPFEEMKKAIEERLIKAERDRLHDELIKQIEAKHFVERY